jgi:hypothetical protein
MSGIVVVVRVDSIEAPNGPTTEFGVGRADTSVDDVIKHALSGARIIKVAASVGRP